MESKDIEQKLVDISNVNRAISLTVDSMKANAEVNYLEWMQALRCVSEALKVCITEKVEELAKSTLDDEEQGEAAGAEGGEVEAD